MELPMNIVVITLIVLIAALIFILLLSGWTGQSQQNIGNFFDYFQGVMGGTPAK